MGKAIHFSAAKSLSEEDQKLLEDATRDAIAYAEERERRKKKKSGKRKSISSKKEIVSTKLEEELNKLSDLSLENVSTNLDLLKEMRRLLISSLETTRGAVRANPRPGNVYAMTRLTNDILTLTKAIEDAIDYNELAAVVYNKVVKPFIDRSLLDLGSHIHDTLERYAGDDEKKYKKMQKALTETYRKYGASLEGKIEGMQNRLKKTILNFIK